MKAQKHIFFKYFVGVLTLLGSVVLAAGQLWALAPPAPPAASPSVGPKSQVAESYGRLPLFFIENQGQLDSQVKFYSRGQGQAIFFTPQGMTLSLNRPAKPTLSAPGKASRAVVQLRPQGTRPEVEILATEPLPGKVNYFRGKDPAHWRTDVPTYKSVLYREAYPGIDLKFYGVGQQVEYDLIIKPGADPKQVKFLYQGIKAMKVAKEGDLTITLPDGGKLVQKKPVIYQDIDGRRVSRAGKFRLLPDTHGYGFELASYDARYPLIIDPVILVYSTYLGGSTVDADESGNAIRVDSSGSAYVVGSTLSLDFPVVTPAVQSTYGGGGELGSGDAFITKFNPQGSALVYSTYLGGGNDDVALAIALDAAGNAYVTGETYSTDFPLSATPYQDQLKGVANAFVTKLTPDGQLGYSTYLGGESLDTGWAIAVDNSGNAYVAGDTDSSTFPTLTPYQAQINGAVNGFITKLNPAGNGLLYSTYLGGGVADTLLGIAVDATGAAYVTGETFSFNFPVTDGSQLRGVSDAFITKLNLAGNGLVYSRFMGGGVVDDFSGLGADGGMAIAVDAGGNAHVTGYTQCDNFPTVAPFQASLQGNTNAFVAKLNAAGATVFASYLGGDGVDLAYAIAIDLHGNVYVTGETDSTNFPHVRAYKSQQEGVIDAFVTKINSLGSSIVFSTYLGGALMDYGNGIAVDSFENVYVTGYTVSANFPTQSPYKPTLNGSGAAFVTKLRATDITPTYLLLLL